jgi:F-type H+-transporting ATPase subunit delta
MREIVARRYAKALIRIGQEDGKYEAYGEELKAFGQLWEASPEFRDVMENPIYPKEQRRAIFEAVKEKMGLSPIMVNFIRLLIDKRRVGYLPEIIRCYEKLSDEVAGRLRATVTSAVPLDEASLKAIQEKLEEMTGRKVLLSVQEDPRLIGGVVTKIGDILYDGSIRTQLENLKETLMKG